jgi:hypothetical protein
MSSLDSSSGRFDSGTLALEIAAHGVNGCGGDPYVTNIMAEVAELLAGAAAKRSIEYEAYRLIYGGEDDR